MNAFALIMLQKRVADELGVYVGQYVHTATSFHCYERDFENLKCFYRRYVDSYEVGSSSLLTYSYSGEWKDYMENEQASIATMVEEQKSKQKDIDNGT